MGRFQGDLPERTFDFARSILELVDKLPQKTTAWELGKQLTRSGTGIGANIQEADQAQTTREFARFTNIARREAAETSYWLRLCVSHGLLLQVDAEPALREANELAKILTTIAAKCDSFLKRQE